MAAKKKTETENNNNAKTATSKDRDRLGELEKRVEQLENKLLHPARRS